jgi:hypothetical protein
MNKLNKILQIQIGTDLYRQMYHNYTIDKTVELRSLFDLPHYWNLSDSLMDEYECFLCMEESTTNYT